jgi:hypothetical protein
MTIPTLATTGTGGHRVYRWQGREFPNVTAILDGGVPKPLLPRWAAKVAAEYAIAHLDHLRRLPRGQAIREVKQAPFTKRDDAAEVGDQIHAAVEAQALGRPRPPLPEAAGGFLAGFDRFLADHTPVFLAAEQTVYSRRYGYAGTFDAIATLPGHGVVLVDVKTGNRIYPEVCLQLAAYAAADFIGRPDGTEQPLLAIEAGAVLHLRPGGYQLLPVPSAGPCWRRSCPPWRCSASPPTWPRPCCPPPTSRGGDRRGRPARHAGRRPAGAGGRPGLGLAATGPRHLRRARHLQQPPPQPPDPH